MTAAKHTPGPWHENGYAVEDDDGKLVCNMSGWKNPGATKANARLIARAPDLLTENETLRTQKAQLLEALERIVNDAIDPHGDAKLPIEQYDAARAAIAAARGES